MQLSLKHKSLNHYENVKLSSATERNVSIQSIKIVDSEQSVMLVFTRIHVLNLVSLNSVKNMCFTYVMAPIHYETEWLLCVL